MSSGEVLGATRATEVLDAMRATESLDGRDTFVLGCFERRVTIHSQQTRALNLAAALAEARPGRGEVAVIGAGFAGLTVSAALALDGFEVTVYERGSAPLEVQWTSSRWVHPHVFGWPNMSGHKLPLFDWTAGPVSTVARDIKARWDEVRGQVTPARLRMHTDARVVRRERRLVYERAGSETTVRADVFVVATGFAADAADQRYGYWANMPRGVFAPESTVVVGGNGDGGLMDYLEASTAQLDLRRVVELLDEPQFGEVKRRIVEIESELERRRREDGDPHARNVWLTGEHDRLHEMMVEACLVEPLVQMIGGRRANQRGWTKLVGTSVGPYQERATALNRLLVSLFRPDYECGRVERGVVVPPVIVRRSDDTTVELNADVYVPRVGPERPPISVDLGIDEQHLPRDRPSTHLVSYGDRGWPLLSDSCLTVEVCIHGSAHHVASAVVLGARYLVLHSTYWTRATTSLRICGQEGEPEQHARDLQGALDLVVVRWNAPVFGPRTPLSLEPPLSSLPAVHVRENVGLWMKNGSAIGLLCDRGAVAFSALRNHETLAHFEDLPRFYRPHALEQLLIPVMTAFSLVPDLPATFRTAIDSVGGDPQRGARALANDLSRATPSRQHEVLGELWTWARRRRGIQGTVEVAVGHLLVRLCDLGRIDQSRGQLDAAVLTLSNLRSPDEIHALDVLVVASRDTTGHLQRDQIDAVLGFGPSAHCLGVVITTASVGSQQDGLERALEAAGLIDAQVQEATDLREKALRIGDSFYPPYLVVCADHWTEALCLQLAADLECCILRIPVPHTP